MGGYGDKIERNLLPATRQRALEHFTGRALDSVAGIENSMQHNAFLLILAIVCGIVCDGFFKIQKICNYSLETEQIAICSISDAILQYD
jgi:hypothetical protein